MEDMFSLGNVGLWRMANNGYMSLTGEVGELFITKVLGTIIPKLKYKDVVYAVSKNANERYFSLRLFHIQRKRYRPIDFEHNL